MTTNALNIVKANTTPSLPALIDARERVRAIIASSQQDGGSEHRLKVEQLLLELPRLADAEAISKRVKDIHLISEKYTEQRSNLASLDGEITRLMYAFKQSDPKAYLAALKQRAERLLPAAREYTALEQEIEALEMDAPKYESAPARGDAPIVQAPIVQAPIVQAPIVEAPIVEAPIVEAHTAKTRARG
jgi:hypothetical protein